MSEELKDIDVHSVRASEPVAAVDYAASIEVDDYDFGSTDFGYARTESKLRRALKRADEMRDAPNNWGTFQCMMSDFKTEHSEWFR